MNKFVDSEFKIRETIWWAGQWRDFRKKFTLKQNIDIFISIFENGIVKMGKFYTVYFRELTTTYLLPDDDPL